MELICKWANYVWQSHASQNSKSHTCTSQIWYKNSGEGLVSNDLKETPFEFCCLKKNSQHISSQENMIWQDEIFFYTK